VPGPKAVEIELSTQEKQELEKLVKGHKTEQQIGKRAQLILRASQGQSNNQIKRELELTADTVRMWRGRWQLLSPIPLEQMSVKERLEDLARPGSPARITADQRCQIEGLACEKPEQSERPISQWTNREIADEIIKRKIVTNISARHAGRLLKRSGYKTASDPLLANP
jgi:transposase